MRQIFINLYDLFSIYNSDVKAIAKDIKDDFPRYGINASEDVLNLACPPDQANALFRFASENDDCLLWDILHIGKLTPHHGINSPKSFENYKLEKLLKAGDVAGLVDSANDIYRKRYKNPFPWQLATLKLLVESNAEAAKILIISANLFHLIGKPNRLDTPDDFWKEIILKHKLKDWVHGQQHIKHIRDFVSHSSLDAHEPEMALHSRLDSPEEREEKHRREKAQKEADIKELVGKGIDIYEGVAPEHKQNMQQLKAHWIRNRGELGKEILGIIQDKADLNFYDQLVANKARLRMGGRP